VTAKLGVPRGGGSAAPAAAAGGSLTLRYQPSPDVPFSFVDIKARSRGAASAAAVRACLFDPATRLAVYAEVPVVSSSGGAAPPAAALRLGAKYTTPTFSAGAVVDPAGSVLQQAFVVRVGGEWGGSARVPASDREAATRLSHRLVCCVAWRWLSLGWQQSLRAHAAVSRA
jgi:hypothetical protein